MKPRLITAIVCAVTLGSFVACGAPGLTDVSGDGGRAANTLGNNGFLDAKLIKCPTEETASNTALVTPLGGLVSAGGTTVTFPAGLLDVERMVTVTVPASRYMYVEITIADVPHPQFPEDLPVTISMSYARCADPALSLTPLTAWYVDLDDKEMLEPKASADNKLTKTVTFTTTHFSGYALAD